MEASWFSKNGKTITGDYLSEFVTILRIKIKKKRRDVLAKDLEFLRDNALIHTSRIVMNSNSGFRVGIVETFTLYSRCSSLGLLSVLSNKEKSKKTQVSVYCRELREAVTMCFLNGLKVLQARCNKRINLRGEYVE